MVLLLRRLYDRFAPIDEQGLEYLESLEPNQEVAVTVKKAKKEEIRRAAQNRLYWMWLDDMQNTTCNEHAGTTKNEWHVQMKRKFLLPIYEREGKSPEFVHLNPYAITMDALRSAYRNGAVREVDILLNEVARKSTTTEASVKQFAEYLTEIQRFCWKQGIWLRTDDGLMDMAINGD